MPDQWAIGDLIDNQWEVTDVIPGGMGVVYIVYGHDPAFQEAFAVKTITDETLRANPVAAERFREEARAWVELDLHDNVVQARFVEEIEGKPYIFLEYISGGDLESWIAMPNLTKVQTLKFALQFCDGMLHAISKGIRAHRDVKPKNCMITEDGTLKVTDFGLAKIADLSDVELIRGQQQPARNYNLTQANERWGSRPYMSPEQYDDFRLADARSDIYSFGVMFFQMLMGGLPFEGQSEQEFEHLHKTAPVPLLAGENTRFGIVIERCLEKTPDARYQDFQYLRNDLADIYIDLTGDQPPESASGRELDAKNLANKGSLLLALKRYDRALVFTEQALEIHPGWQPVLCNKGAIIDALGRHDEAIFYLSQAIMLNQKDEKSWTNKAVALEAKGDYKRALNHYRTARVLRPDIAMMWYHEGKLLNAMGRHMEARNCFRQCVKRNPHDADAWAMLGLSYAWLSNHEKAAECYTEAERLGLDGMDRPIAINKSFITQK